MPRLLEPRTRLSPDKLNGYLYCGEDRPVL